MGQNVYQKHFFQSLLLQVLFLFPVEAMWLTHASSVLKEMEQPGAMGTVSGGTGLAELLYLVKIQHWLPRISADSKFSCVFSLFSDIYIYMFFK